MMSIRQQNESAPRGAVRTHRFSGGDAPSAALQPPQRVVQERGPDGPSSSKRARGRRGDEHELERQPRRVGREQHRVAVDGDEPLAPAHLLLHEVGEQVAAHRPRGVGAEALPLARDARGHEVEGVQLRVRVRQRRAALACAR